MVATRVPRWRERLADRPRPGALVWLLLSALLIGLDQWTKAWAISRFTFRGDPVPLIDGFWNWVLVPNYGAAFSFLAWADGWQRWLFSGLAVVISLVLSFWLWVTPRRDWRMALPLALVIGGAIGNLIDRIRFGYVVDFIDWYAGAYHWPAFNVADACIVGGAIGLVLFSFGEGKRAPEGG